MILKSLLDMSVTCKLNTQESVINFQKFSGLRAASTTQASPSHVQGVRGEPQPSAGVRQQSLLS